MGSRTQANKIYLSTWSVHRLFLANLLKVGGMPALARSLGFDGVELEDIWFGPRQSMKPLLSEARRFRSSLLIAVSNDFTVGTGETLRVQIEHTTKFLRLASRIRSSTVRVLVGSRHSRPSTLMQVVQAFRRIMPLAHQLNLKVAIENHDALSKKPAVLRSILELVDSPRLGVCLDFGNLNSSTRYEAIRELAPCAFMVHAKSYSFTNKGTERTIDFARCFRILREAKFRGPVVAEYDGPGDQVAGTLRTLALIRRTMVQ